MKTVYDYEIERLKCFKRFFVALMGSSNPITALGDFLPDSLLTLCKENDLARFRQCLGEREHPLHVTEPYREVAFSYDPNPGHVDSPFYFLDPNNASTSPAVPERLEHQLTRCQSLPYRYEIARQDNRGSQERRAAAQMAHANVRIGIAEIGPKLHTAPDVRICAPKRSAR